MLCIGSGKGGVGKSTLTVNLAAALQAEGKKVGVLDADVWGYSIPRMLGLGGQRPKVSAERKILPLESHGIKVISIGFFLKEDEAVVWRGPMLHKALTQFLDDVAWGELDYLLIDLPPGTGDVSMTLSQLLPQATFMIVTTPQDAAQKVARRSAQMADKVNLEISAVIENMSGFTTPSGERFPIFGEGGGQRLADELDVPLLGQIPLTMPLRAHADAGIPLVAVDPDDPAAQAIRHAARGLIAMAPAKPIALPVLEVVQTGPPQPVGMSLPMAVAGCDARRWRASLLSFAGEVGRVALGEAGPLVGQLVFSEARVDRARLDAGVAVDALVRVDVELFDLVVVRLVGRRVDAVDGADLDAGVVLGSDAGLGDHVGHGPNGRIGWRSTVLLLTGATGLLGHAVVRRLVANRGPSAVSGAGPAAAWA